jgi:glucoamylase
MGALEYRLAKPAVATSDLATIAPYMLWLMFRNVASDGFVFEDPVNAGVLSRPGCVLASPSWATTANVSQDYVYNWTRDAAVVAIELASGTLRTTQPLLDYVAFAQACQSAGGDFDRAAFLIDGAPRPNWTDQTDGPALQTLAIMQLWPQLDPATQTVADAVTAANLSFLASAYQGQTYNLWEEEYGNSFFARSVQLRCCQAIAANTLGIAVPEWVSAAVPWLQNALADHWNGQYYQSMLPVPAPPDYRVPYDPNIDIVMAAIYGAVAVTDTRLLATAALLRSQWEDPASPYHYPINAADQARGIGPLLGRYPGDKYDGDNDQPADDHPWAISTCNFAELYYRLAGAVTSAATIPLDSNSAAFFTQIGVSSSTPPAAAATALQTAGDEMLQAVIFHSDHLELSEQFDAWTGYEKSVSNLSWSYASFLSAVRARHSVTS